MTPLRLLVSAAILHVALAGALFIAGRTRIVPALIDPDGIVGRAAVDSYVYQHAAIPLAAALSRADIGMWMRTPAPPHARALSIAFAALSPLAGYSALAAEPYNLFCYLAVVALVLAIGREAGGERAGAIAATMVAVWPTFVIHTLQLLKDPLFIAGALALVHILLTWVTATYDWRRAVRVGAMLLIASGLVLVVRPQFLIVLLALIALALGLLVVRQIVERQFLPANMSCAAVTLVFVAAAALALAPPQPHEVVKPFPAPDTGEPKDSAGTLVPTSIWRSPSRRGRWEAADRASLVLGSVRSRFAYTSAAGGAGIDDAVVFLSARDAAAYLPRAAALGFWAPFPSDWLASGHTVGTSGRILAGLETLAIYLCEGLAIAAVLFPPRRIAAALLLLFVAFGVTAEAMVVANLGALYRFRYVFCLLLIALGAIGFSKLRPRRVGAAATVGLAVLSASCAGPRPAAPHDVMTVANITGFPVQGIYLSPRGARTWQENVLARDVLTDGRAVDVRFPAGAKSVAWDLRVQGADGYRGVWSNLDLSTVSRLTLRIAHGTLVADLEDER